MFILLGRTSMTLNVDNVVIKLHPSRQLSFLVVLEDGGRASVFTAGPQVRGRQVYCWINTTSSWVFPALANLL